MPTSAGRLSTWSPTTAWARVRPSPCLASFPDPGYFRMDGGFSYRLPKGVEIFGRMDNLLDRKYEEVLGYPSLPFNFVAGVRYSFTPRRS